MQNERQDRADRQKKNTTMETKTPEEVNHQSKLFYSNITEPLANFLIILMHSVVGEFCI